MQKHQAEPTKLFKRLYEDCVLGRIPDEGMAETVPEDIPDEVA